MYSSTSIASQQNHTDTLELPSLAMQSLKQQVARLSMSNLPIHIHGESGVGKDVLARSIHQQSGRSGPFIVINAGGLSPTLAQSELFGHVAGSFTGAHKDRCGAFEAAHGGTLFLDEIADLSLGVQAELLRVVETGRVRRVGDHREIPVDVRIITATHFDLNKRVQEGLFRLDLFHRLCVVPLVIPPLRERPEDILAITTHLLAKEQPKRALTQQAMRKLTRYTWPGNIRELGNVLRRACILSSNIILDASDFELNTATIELKHPAAFINVIAESVLTTYNTNGGNVAQTAKMLGVRRSLVQDIVRSKKRQHTPMATFPIGFEPTLVEMKPYVSLYS